MQQHISAKLTTELNPSHLEVINESPQHNVAQGSESHFKLIVVSQAFSELSLIKRHQIIYKILAEELANHIHALTMHLFTASEWQARDGNVSASPKCRGGHAS